MSTDCTALCGQPAITQARSWLVDAGIPQGPRCFTLPQHLSLACLEILVHLDKAQLPQEYVWSSTRLPKDPAVLETINVRELTACQTAGQEWAEEANELAVRVRSVVILEEFNVVLNPKHRDYYKLVWSNPRPFHFDPRLFTFKPQPD